MGEPREELEDILRFLRASDDDRRGEFVVGVRNEDALTVRELPVPDEVRQRIDRFVADAAGPWFAAVVEGRRQLVAYDDTAIDSDGETLPAYRVTDLDLTPGIATLLEGEAVEEWPADPFVPSADLLTDAGRASFRAFRLDDGERTVVGLQQCEAGNLWRDSGPFTLVRTDTGYETVSSPVLTIPAQLDVLCVDGTAFVFESTAFEELFDRDDGADETAVTADDEQPTVLVVEDEERLADMYATYLRGPYDVRTAYGGEEALALADGDVDAILLDRLMPDLNGDEVLDRLRDRGLQCGVAMVTAVDPDFDIIELGFDDYVTKPVSKAELRESVERLLEVDDYDDMARELSSLRVRRNVLQTEKSEEELAGSDEFAGLETRIEALDARIAAAPGTDTTGRAGRED